MFAVFKVACARFRIGLLKSVGGVKFLAEIIVNGYPEGFFKKLVSEASRL